MGHIVSMGRRRDAVDLGTATWDLGAMAISVVTGAAGFVGQALVRRLLADGDEVRALTLPNDRRIEELRALGGEHLQIVEADVRDGGSVASAVGDATRVFHTAAVVHAWVP